MCANAHDCATDRNGTTPIAWSNPHTLTATPHGASNIAVCHFRCKEIAMGMLDGLLTNMMGGAAGQGQSQLLGVALQLIQQNGGLPGILSKFEHGGMAEHAQSWTGTGANMPVTGGQLQEILGSGAIGQIAAQLGMSHGDASAGLAQVLPQLISHLTPAGQVPDDHSDMLAQALQMIKSRTA
jgi:uncharacterized protein YidB (DUF937 family)